MTSGVTEVSNFNTTHPRKFNYPQNSVYLQFKGGYSVDLIIHRIQSLLEAIQGALYMVERFCHYHNNSRFVVVEEEWKCRIPCCSMSLINNK